jgi:Helix-turn-helix domain
VTEPLPRDWWTTGDVASYLEVAPSTIRAYAARGQMPAADRRIGREPVWRPETIRKWQRQRPRRDHSDAEPTA